ncbi:MAG TPA: DUF4845 domain-containing protein [Terriglobales bacterium]|nr:DUF4845 domain-containing protein [Terriglobales bacterium]
MRTLRLLIVLAVVGTAFYVGYLVVPVYWGYYQFQDAIESEARIQSYSTKSETEMRDTVWKKAQQLELPLTSEDDIKVQRTGSVVAISTQYSVHIAAPFHPFDLNFTPSTQNKPAY